MKSIRVVKLGGSLLLRSDWPQRLRNWLVRQSAASTLIVVGGGELIESIRELDRAHAFSQHFTHWICIDMLTHTAQIAAQLLPEFPQLAAPEELQAWIARDSRSIGTSVAVVKVAAFYSRQCYDQRLPEDWTTTTDSLAALLADQIEAAELVLLKSTGFSSESSNAAELSHLGIIDAAFPKIVPRKLHLRLVNLADDDFPQIQVST